MFILLVAFVIVADQAYIAAHPPTEMRRFRGVHLGLNLAGMFIFPIFTYIGIPLSLGKLRKYRSSNPTAYKWALGTGIVTLLILTTTILLAIISASITTNDYDDFSRCRKRSVLQVMPTTKHNRDPHRQCRLSMRLRRRLRWNINAPGS
jgi:hypothetical protein